jgi:hypothetical protein
LGPARSTGLSCGIAAAVFGRLNTGRSQNTFLCSASQRSNCDGGTSEHRIEAENQMRALAEIVVATMLIVTAVSGIGLASGKNFVDGTRLIHRGIVKMPMQPAKILFSKLG